MDTVDEFPASLRKLPQTPFSEQKSDSIFLMRGSTVLALALLTGGQMTHGQGPKAQTASWTTVSPDFSSQVLLNHKNEMWAAGSEGRIAVSVDAGQHWQKKHEDPRDGLLLVLGFV